MNKSSIMILCIGLAVEAMGCASADVGSEEDETFTQTLVHLNPDGTQNVRTATISRAQQLADVEVKQQSDALAQQGLGVTREAVTVDSLCASTDSLHLWVGANFTGNELCYTGTGTADLPSGFFDNVGSWASPFEMFGEVSGADGDLILSQSFIGGQSGNTLAHVLLQSVWLGGAVYVQSNNLLQTNQNGTLANSGAVSAVDVSPSGSVIGVGTNDVELWTAPTPGVAWTGPIPNSGDMHSIATLSNGTFVGVGTNQAIYTLAALGDNWVFQNSGPVVGITVLPNGTYVVIGTNNELYTLATLGSSLGSPVANSGDVISIVALPAGGFLGVGTNGCAYTLAALGDSWQGGSPCGYIAVGSTG
jgi:hypothetical protein